MTKRKAENRLDRTPRYVSRETGAAELDISPQTWDRWVKEGRLPPPAPGGSPDSPRWRWKDVDAKLMGKTVATGDPFIEAVERYGTTTDNRDRVSPRRGN